MKHPARYYLLIMITFFGSCAHSAKMSPDEIVNQTIELLIESNLPDFHVATALRNCRRKVFEKLKPQNVKEADAREEEILIGYGLDDIYQPLSPMEMSHNLFHRLGDTLYNQMFVRILSSANNTTADPETVPPSKVFGTRAPVHPIFRSAQIKATLRFWETQLIECLWYDVFFREHRALDMLNQRLIDFAHQGLRKPIGPGAKKTTYQGHIEAYRILTELFYHRIHSDHTTLGDLLDNFPESLTLRNEDCDIIYEIDTTAARDDFNRCNFFDNVYEAQPKGLMITPTLPEDMWNLILQNLPKPENWENIEFTSYSDPKNLPTYPEARDILNTALVSKTHYKLCTPFFKDKRLLFWRTTVSNDETHIVDSATPISVTASRNFIPSTFYLVKVSLSGNVILTERGLRYFTQLPLKEISFIGTVFTFVPGFYSEKLGNTPTLFKEKGYPLNVMFNGFFDPRILRVLNNGSNIATLELHNVVPGCNLQNALTSMTTNGNVTINHMPYPVDTAQGVILEELQSLSDGTDLFDYIEDFMYQENQETPELIKALLNYLRASTSVRMIQVKVARPDNWTRCTNLTDQIAKFSALEQLQTNFINTNFTNFVGLEKATIDVEHVPNPDVDEETGAILNASSLTFETALLVPTLNALALQNVQIQTYFLLNVTDFTNLRALEISRGDYHPNFEAYGHLVTKALYKKLPKLNLLEDLHITGGEADQISVESIAQLSNLKKLTFRPLYYFSQSDGASSDVSFAPLEDLVNLQNLSVDPVGGTSLMQFDDGNIELIYHNTEVINKDLNDSKTEAYARAESLLDTVLGSTTITTFNMVLPTTSAFNNCPESVIKNLNLIVCDSVLPTIALPQLKNLTIKLHDLLPPLHVMGPGAISVAALTQARLGLGGVNADIAILNLWANNPQLESARLENLHHEFYLLTLNVANNFIKVGETRMSFNLNSATMMASLSIGENGSVSYISEDGTKTIIQ